MLVALGSWLPPGAQVLPIQMSMFVLSSSSWSQCPACLPVVSVSAYHFCFLFVRSCWSKLGLGNVCPTCLVLQWCSLFAWNSHGHVCASCLVHAHFGMIAARWCLSLFEPEIMTQREAFGAFTSSVGTDAQSFLESGCWCRRFGFACWRHVRFGALLRCWCRCCVNCVGLEAACWCHCSVPKDCLESMAVRVGASVMVPAGRQSQRFLSGFNPDVKVLCASSVRPLNTNSAFGEQSLWNSWSMKIAFAWILTAFPTIVCGLGDCMSNYYRFRGKLFRHAQKLFV